MELKKKILKGTAAGSASTVSETVPVAPSTNQPQYLRSAPVPQPRPLTKTASPLASQTKPSKPPLTLKALMGTRAAKKSISEVSKKDSPKDSSPTKVDEPTPPVKRPSRLKEAPAHRTKEPEPKLIRLTKTDSMVDNEKKLLEELKSVLHAEKIDISKTDQFVLEKRTWLNSHFPLLKGESNFPTPNHEAVGEFIAEHRKWLLQRKVV